MKKVYDMVVKTGSYQKDGETKNRYENIGSVMKSDDGSFLILKRTFNPAGVPNPENKDSLIVSLFEVDKQNKPQQSQQQQAPQQQQAQQSQQGYDNNFDDDIPF